MNVFREGAWVSEPFTGNTLSLELFVDDAAQLVEHGIATHRMMEFKRPLAGWAAEDKVHVQLSGHPSEDTDQIAELSLDHGGDLYYTIWGGRNGLLRAMQCELFDNFGTFVRSDPSGLLGRLGITAARIYGLPSIPYTTYQVQAATFRED